jgi:hypothetical protein
MSASRTTLSNLFCPAKIAQMIHPNIDVSRFRYHRNERAAVFSGEFAHFGIHAHKKFCERSAAKIPREDELTHLVPKDALMFKSPISVFGVTCEHRPPTSSN